MPEKIKNILLVIIVTFVVAMGGIVFYQQKKINQMMDFLGLAQSPSETNMLGPSPDNQAAIQESVEARERERREMLPKTLGELKETKVLEGILKSAERGKLKIEAQIVDIEKVKSDADIAAAPLIEKEFEVLLVKDTFMAGGKTPDKMKDGDTIRVVCKEKIYEASEKTLTAETVISPADAF